MNESAVRALQVKVFDIFPLLMYECKRKNKFAIVQHETATEIPPHPPLLKGGWGDFERLSEMTIHLARLY